MVGRVEVAYIELLLTEKCASSDRQAFKKLNLSSYFSTTKTVKRHTGLIYNLWRICPILKFLLCGVEINSLIKSPNDIKLHQLQNYDNN